MGREERRKLERSVRKDVAKAHARGNTIMLQGGPMDGWLVIEGNTPCLSPLWWTTWPTSVSAKWKPGRYVVDPELRVAKWKGGA